MAAGAGEDVWAVRDMLVPVLPPPGSRIQLTDGHRLAVGTARDFIWYASLDCYLIEVDAALSSARALIEHYGWTRSLIP